ncbi:DUF3800 domain-containing protein [Patescibacteria group bacterium]|nr:DUF3800 domain-containing protein [Patescibacteria group bacterium]
MKNNDLKTIHIYSDESRHKGERFLLLGGLWVEKKQVAVLKGNITRLRNKHAYTNSQGKKIPFAGELKWTKVSNKYFQVYKDLVDLFFDGINKDKFRFCCLLLDTHLPEVVEYANLNREGYFKILCQLYFHNSKIPAEYKMFPDKISNPTKNVNLPELQSALNNAFMNKFCSMINPVKWNSIGNLVKTIQPLDSKKEDIIQLVDVVLGSIGYFQNRHFEKKGAKKAKVKLMKYVLNKLILNGTILFSGKKFIVAKSTKFNIWMFRPRGNKNGWKKV